MTFNNPHVDLLTRRWLRSAHAELGAMLDDLETVLKHHRRQNLAGLVYDAAMLLELPDEHCEALASFAELFYCCTQAIDDLQDGDGDEYMPWDLWRQVNAAMGLLSLSSLRLLEVWRDDLLVFGSISCDTTRTTYEMVCAQHAELQARATGYAPPWDIDAYEQHARWTAGSELALFLGAIGTAAGGKLTSALRDIGYTVGVLLQIRVDSATSDERITVLPVEAVDDLRRRQTELFFNHAQALRLELVAKLAGVAGLGDET
jgi:hypothetical protein